jgi:hypothetical protein
MLPIQELFSKPRQIRLKKSVKEPDITGAVTAVRNDGEPPTTVIDCKNSDRHCWKTRHHLSQCQPLPATLILKVEFTVLPCVRVGTEYF